MGQEVNLLNQFPRTKRPIEGRARLVTEEHREVARQFGQEFFDGNRLYGYGGYYYDPRFWQATVRRFRDHYGLPEDAAILDVGCAKGFMLHDFLELMLKQQTDTAGQVGERSLENTERVVLGVTTRPFESDDAYRGHKLKSGQKI